MQVGAKVSRSLFPSKSVPPEPILSTVPQVLSYSCRSLGSHRKVSQYQERAFSSRPGNRARKNATVPASRVWRDAARRGQKPTLQPFPTDTFSLAASSDTRRKS
jgi:hypothetical protein